MAPDSRRQFEYDRFMKMKPEEQVAALDNLENKMKHGTYWADEVFQVTG